MPIQRTRLEVPTLLVLLLSSPALAVVNFVAPGIAGSVSNVQVGSSLYDVSFVGDVSHADWVDQLDFATEAEAQDAAAALAAELNAAGATAARFSLPTGGTFDHTNATTWYAASDTEIFGESTIRLGGTWRLANPLPGGATAPINDSFPFAADWTPVSTTSVPSLSPAASLLCAALTISLGLLGLRQRPRHIR